MSSRQLKWMREQINKRKKKKEVNEEDEYEYDEQISNQQESKFSNLAPDIETLETQNINKEVDKVKSIPLPRNIQDKKNTKKTASNDEFELLEKELQDKVSVNDTSDTKKEVFNMSDMNIGKELKEKLGINAFDDYILGSSNGKKTWKFIQKKRSFPTPFPNFFKRIDQTANKFKIDYSDEGMQQNDMFSVFQALNEAQNIMDMSVSFPFCPLTIPIHCQSLFFEGKFDAATDAALKGLYVIQQTLPPYYVPLVTKIDPSPAREEFLKLIAFLARFSFRRGCFTSSLALWKFGLSLTEDDPCNFILYMAVPALYKSDADLLKSILNSDREWRGIPIRYIPDWSICYKMLTYGEDVTELAVEFARWPFVFESDGLAHEFDIPPVLDSVGKALRKRIDPFVKRSNFSETFETAIAIASSMPPDPDEMSELVSLWYSVDMEEIDISQYVEEMYLPAVC